MVWCGGVGCVGVHSPLTPPSQCLHLKALLFLDSVHLDNFRMNTTGISSNQNLSCSYVTLTLFSGASDAAEFSLFTYIYILYVPIGCSEAGLADTSSFL